MKFQIFFFKENTRSIDIESLVNFLLEDENTCTSNEEDQFCVDYHNRLIDLDFSFVFSRVSRVPDIARLDPRYLDLDCYVEFDMLLPLFKVNIISNLIEKVCGRFNFLIYNYLFNDVSPFTRDIIKQAYDRTRRLYKEKFPAEYQGLTFVSKSILDVYYKYLVDAKATSEYYEDKYLFSNTYFGVNSSNNEVCLIADFKLERSFVIPPNVDIILLELNDNRFYYRYKEVEVLLKKFLKDFPGFIGNTKMIDESSLKKIKKILTKMKVQPVLDRIVLIDKESLIDF